MSIQPSLCIHIYTYINTYTHTYIHYITYILGTNSCKEWHLSINFTLDCIAGLASLFQIKANNVFQPKQKLAMETELHEKDAQVLKLSIQYNECENDLQRTKQLLLLQQQHCQELDAQVPTVTARVQHCCPSHLSTLDDELAAPDNLSYTIHLFT